MKKHKLIGLLLLVIPFLGVIALPWKNSNDKLNLFSNNYGLTECANPKILIALDRSKAGILKCTVNNQTHIADVKGEWGYKSWINDLYFGIMGGLYVADSKQQNVFKAELRKISKFVLTDTSRFEIVPYAVDSSGKSFDRNQFDGVDYDRCAEFILATVRLYEFTGDLEFLKEMYPVDLRIINWLKKQNRDKDILLEGRSLPSPIKGVGSCVSVTYIGDAVKNDFKDFGASLFLYQALVRLSEAEDILGKSEFANKHRIEASNLKKALHKIMWNENSKGFLGWIDGRYRKHDDWITGNNTYAVECGVANLHQTKLIMERLDENRTALIDVVPCRSRIDTFNYGYSSNPVNYYWNGGCWPVIAAPVMLAYRKVNDLEGALHVMDVLSTKVTETKFGFYECYWGNSGKHNSLEGLLMNNGGVLWGFYEGIMGIKMEGDKLIFQDNVPSKLLPAKACFHYRNAEIIVHWISSDKSSATLNNRNIEKTLNSYILRLNPKPGEIFNLDIGVSTKL